MTDKQLQTRRGNPLIAACIPVLIATVGIALAGLGPWQFWDDEGYVLQSIRSFMQGHALYSEVYTQYGPAYYWLTPLLYGFDTNNVSLDLNRIHTITRMLLGAAIGSFIVFRCTKSVLMSSVAFVLLAPALNGFAHEAGHPQEMLVLLILIVTLFFGWRPAMSLRKTVLVGVLCGTAFCIKINVGLIVSAICGLSYLYTTQTIPITRHIRRAIAIIATIAFLIAAYLLNLHPQWQSFFAACGASFFGTALFAEDRHQSTEAHGKTRHIFTLILASIVTAACYTLGTLAQGTPLDALLDGMVLQHFSQDKFSIRPELDYLPPLAILPLYLFPLLYLRFRSRIKTLTSWYTIFVFSACIAAAFGDTFSPLSAAAVFFALTQTWLLLSYRNDQADTDLRIFIAWACPWMMLQAFPVAGSQLFIGFVFPLIALCILAHDAGSTLLTYYDLTEKTRRLLEACTYWLATMFAAAFTVSKIFLFTQTVPIDLPGAHYTRTFDVRANSQRWIAYNLEAHSDVFTLYPNILSQYIWTGSNPPTHKNAGVWHILLNEKEQRDIIDVLEQNPRRAYVHCKELSAFWDRQGFATKSSVLIDFLRAHYQKVATFLDCDLYTAHSVSRDSLLQSVLIEEQGDVGIARAHVTLTRAQQKAIHAVSLSAVSGTIYRAYYHPDEALPFSLSQETVKYIKETLRGAQLNKPIELSFTMRMNRQKTSTHQVFLRIQDAEERSIALLPVFMLEESALLEQDDR